MVKVELCACSIELLMQTGNRTLQCPSDLEANREMCACSTDEGWWLGMKGGIKLFSIEVSMK